MSSQYTSELPPSVPLDPRICKFFEDFYAISDTPDAHEKYAGMFTDDATFILGSTRAVGKEEILALRKGMWTAIKSRSHRPLKVFPFGPNATEVMLYGTVSYEFRVGGGTSKDWAGRAEMVKLGGEWRLGLYQVYLDTAAAQQPSTCSR